MFMGLDGTHSSPKDCNFLKLVPSTPSLHKAPDPEVSSLTKAVSKEAALVLVTHEKLYEYICKQIQHLTPEQHIRTHFTHPEGKQELYLAYGKDNSIVIEISDIEQSPYFLTACFVPMRDPATYELRFYTQTRNPEHPQQTHAYMNPEEFIRACVSRFPQALSREVSYVIGHWPTDTPNYKEFEEALRVTKNYKSALETTWTSKVLKKVGYGPAVYQTVGGVSTGDQALQVVYTKKEFEPEEGEKK